jgi:thiol-disulfide isomerase/thioredoxin
VPVLPRVRAPELRGRGWLNTGGTSLRIADLRGRFILLDFWTFCCVNCLHVIDELRPLEKTWGDGLVVIGVHSPKFVHEADPAALADAVERYEVAHPVLDDPDLTTWDAYTARAWPTLVLVDPDGYVVAQYAGEGHVHAIDALIRSLRPSYSMASGPLAIGSPIGDLAHRRDTSVLRFPSKVISLPNGTLLVADAGHHRLVELASAHDREALRVIGSGVRGRDDGLPGDASFAEPNGLCLLPPEVAAAVGYDVVVADTANHLLRGIRLADGTVTTVAGTGEPWMPAPGTTVSISEQDVSRLSTPWDVTWWRRAVWIAMAGIHQLWTFDPRTGAVVAAAGTRNEGLVDGPLDEAWFAQPSGLAVAPDGSRLWVADSETSAVRELVDRPDGALVVNTLVGQGLFDFGLLDGPAANALLQHPLGVTALPDGTIAVSDTYNGAIRLLSRAADDWNVSTLTTGLAEPSGALLLGQDLVVVESAAHRLTRVPWSADSAALVAEPSVHVLTRTPMQVAPGAVDLVVVFTPPPGEKLDTSFGPATQLQVSSTPPALLTTGTGTGTDLARTLRIDASVGSGVLHVSARAASCEIDAEHPVCRLHQQDWGVPVRVEPGAPSEVVLVLAG